MEDWDDDLPGMTICMLMRNRLLSQVLDGAQHTCQEKIVDRSGVMTLSKGSETCHAGSYILWKALSINSVFR